MKLNGSNFTWSWGWLITTFYTKSFWGVGVVATAEASRSMYLPHITKEVFIWTYTFRDSVKSESRSFFPQYTGCGIMILTFCISHISPLKKTIKAWIFFLKDAPWKALQNLLKEILIALSNDIFHIQNEPHIW